jgi:ketosteroid isomerase-like protein
MFAMVTPAQSQTGTIPSENKVLVQQAFDAWAAGIGSPYDLLAENVKWTIIGNSLASKTYGSRDAFIGEIIRPFNARMSVGLKPTIRQMYTDGDTEPPCSWIPVGPKALPLAL